MRIIRQRTPQIRDYRANDYDRVRLKEVAQDRCGICMDLWPQSMMTMEDGYSRCPDCLAIKTEAVKRDIEAHDAQMQHMKQTRPQTPRGAALRENSPAFIRIMERTGGTRVQSQSSPLVLTAGGAAKALIIVGGGFAATDTFSYTSGITNNSAPSLSGSSEWTLSLVAAGGTSKGFKHLTFNNHTYRNLLQVV